MLELPMKRFLVLVAFLGPLLITAACGQPQLTVEAALTDGAGERLALGDQPFRLLPYDRDAIFDSLEMAYPEPEPPIPSEIVEAQQRVQVTQTAWRAAEERWSTIRDSMRILLEDLEQMRGRGLQATPQYNQGYVRYTSLESQERQVNQQRAAAFAAFDQLQQQTLASADSIRIQRELWADQAFADFNRIVAAKLDQAGREELADTTNSQGFARLSVPEGRWWLYSRYTLPYEELYWNIPLDITGDSVSVTLNRENAEVRPIL
jgi:hypothetical protein